MGKALEQRAPRHRRDRSQSPGEADVMLPVSGFGYRTALHKGDCCERVALLRKAH